MKTTILIAVLCLAGCGADNKSIDIDCMRGYHLAWDSELDYWKCFPNTSESKPEPEPYIGEYYECKPACSSCFWNVETEKKMNCDCLYMEDCEWHKFRKSDVLDKHKGEIKVGFCFRRADDGSCIKRGDGSWQSRYFYYADVPDRFQKKREEIETNTKGEQNE